MKLSVTDKFLAGNKPFYLDSTDHFWLVVTGQVDVYFVQRDKQGNATSARHYMYTVSPGEMLFSMKDRGDESSISLFVTSEDAKLLELNKSNIKNIESIDLAGRVDKWITKCANYVEGFAPPKEYVDLQGVDEIELNQDAISYPSDGTVWILCQEGDIKIYGQNLLLSGQSIKNNLIPVTKGFYIEAVQKSKIQIYQTIDIIRDEITILFALKHLHAYLQEKLVAFLEIEKENNEVGFETKKNADNDLLHHSLNKLKSIVNKQDNDQIFSEITNTNQVLGACQVIGNVTGFDFKEPKHIDCHHRGLTSQLNDIAKISNIRLRKVILRGQWWKEENGHLFAFLKENKDPVALIQKSGGGYQIQNSRTKEVAEIDKDIAASIDPISHMFLYSFDEKMTTVTKLWSFAIKGLKKDAAWILIASLCGSLLGLLVPVVTGILYDDIVPQADRNYLYDIFGILVLLAVISSLLRLIKGVLLLRVETKSNLTIQAGLMDHLLRLPVNFFKKYTAGDLTMRALGINTIRQILSGVVLTAVLSGTFSIVNLGLLFYYNSKLALIGVALAAIAVVFVIIMGLLKLKYDRQISDHHGELQGLLFEFLSGISKVRIAGTEKRFFALWASKFAHFKNLGFKSGNYQNFVEVFNGTYPLVTNIMFFGFIYYVMSYSGLNTGELMSVGIFMAFISAFNQFLGDCLNMSQALISSLNMIPLYERVKPILEENPETPIDSMDPGELSGHIELNSVSFRYQEDQPLVLKDVSLKIKQGEMVAFIGPSGSGKSTVMRLLLGFEQPEVGSIYFDGQRFDELNKEMVRRQTGVVLQNGSLMSGSIFQNIIGNSELTLEQATEAAHMAGLEDDIKHMPMGMHTVVSDGASTFSGGQRQRLMIARAIVHKPRMLFMDEATSALDNRTQTIVSQSLDKLQATRIIIAHRLSTVMNADRIIVMDKGRIVQQGTYDELINSDGLFSMLAKRQIA